MHVALLWEIMLKHGYPKYLINFIESLYNGTSFIVDVSNYTVGRISINHGVREGCNLSPIIFNMYIDDAIRKGKKLQNQQNKT